MAFDWFLVGFLTGSTVVSAVVTILHIRRRAPRWTVENTVLDNREAS